jgi:glycine/D-amino acid oxidase-like deaminating enzyme
MSNAGRPAPPDGADHIVIGAGVHGLATAGALARRLRATGSAARVVVLERHRVGAGASGIAGGIVRGYYRSPAIMEIVRRSVELFEGAPEAFGFRQVGFLAVVPERQRADLEAIAERQAEVGYESELVLGADACREYLTWLWPDFDADGVAAVLHEKRSGWADAAATVRELARRAQADGVEIVEGVEVLGFERRGDAVGAVVTDHGTVSCEHVVLAAGVWARDMWRALGLDFTAELDGRRVALVDLVRAQEGDFVLPGVGLQAGAGLPAPVVHYDADGPLCAPDGRVLESGPWGIYFRMGHTGTGVTVGGLPTALGPDAPLDPYGPENPDHRADAGFVAFAEAGLARAMRRFRDPAQPWQASPHGGVVGLTPDGYPVLDRVLDNVYAILDAGHTYKMLALGELAAADVLDGSETALEPFRLSRFGLGQLQPASNSPYPWT